MALKVLQSLFGQKPHAPAQNNTWLIVGLGNPGAKYAQTRHNVGFLALDQMAGGEPWKQKTKLQGELAEILLSKKKALLLKPQTFMNKSGMSVQKALTFYKIPVRNLIVVHDEVDIPFGEVRSQTDRSSAGHNGVQSIIDALGTKAFTRIRVGVGRPPNKNIPTDKWVLGTWSKEEHHTLGDLLDKIQQAVESAIEP